jgi:MFS family permease
LQFSLDCTIDNSSLEDCMKKGMKLYFAVIAFTALGLALSNDVMSNFFKEAYNVTAYQRGLIEFPRELPGMLLIVVVAGLSFLSDIRISIIAQILSIIGLLALGVFTPSFSVMLIFIFINSMGMHLFFPMQDSIGMSLAEPENIGQRMGQYKGMFTAFQMIGTGIVFLGFKLKLFSFETPTKWIFIISALLFMIVAILFIYLNKAMHIEGNHPKKVKFIIRKEYKFYYTLVVLYGAQKQMMIVYGPWVLIELLGKRTETIALLGIIGMFIGIFFIPALGKWLDRFGVKKLLYADGLSFVLVYLFYGILSAGYVSGAIGKSGVPVLLAYVLFILDRMSTQMGIVRTVYFKSIAVDPTDITPTLSLGISLDHVMSIVFGVLGGIVWTQFGPQYIFFLAAALSLINIYIASRIQISKAILVTPN